MRPALVALAVGAALVASCPVLAVDYEPTREETLREQLEALYDVEHAETDEEALAAERRFDDAAEREIQRRRRSIAALIER